MEKEYAVVLIFSGWKLSKIFNFFYDYLDAKEEDIGCSKIERFKDKRSGEMKDTNRTLILLKRNIFRKAIEAGLDLPQPNLDFRITEYFLSEKSYPTEGYTSDLFLIIPKSISVEEAELTISDRIKKMVKFDMLKNDDFSLRIPLESRVTGEHKGHMFLSFNYNLDITIKALIKALLNDSFIFLESSEKLYHLPVFWAKEFNKPPIKVTKILKRTESIIP